MNIGDGAVGKDQKHISVIAILIPFENIFESTNLYFLNMECRVCLFSPSNSAAFDTF